MRAYCPPELPIQPELSFPQDTREQKFEAFDAEYPEVFQEIVKEARSMPEKILHMRRIVENVRGKFKFQIDNNHIPFYVDKIEEKYPIFVGRFHKRARMIRTMKKVPVRA